MPLGFECVAARETGPWIRTHTLSTRHCASYHQAKEADKDRIESCFSNSTRKAVTSKGKGEASEGIRTPDSLPKGECSTTELNALTAGRQLETKQIITELVDDKKKINSNCKNKFEL